MGGRGFFIMHSSHCLTSSSALKSGKCSFKWCMCFNSWHNEYKNRNKKSKAILGMIFHVKMQYSVNSPPELVLMFSPLPGLLFPSICNGLTSLLVIGRYILYFIEKLKRHKTLTKRLEIWQNKYWLPLSKAQKWKLHSRKQIVEDGHTQFTFFALCNVHCMHDPKQDRCQYSAVSQRCLQSLTLLVLA